MKTPAQKAAYRSAWGAANREKLNAQSRARRLADPEKARAYNAKWYAVNADKVNANARKWNKANPEKRAAIARRWAGLPEPLWPMPEICERPGCGRPAKCLDHDHENNAFRGWLCVACNTAIGKLGDDILGLECAIAYLRRST